MEKIDFSVKDWVRAYAEKVGEILNYRNFSIKNSSKGHFERLKNAHPNISPFTFVEAVFPPNLIWWLPNNKGGWKKLKYPFPNMLISKKAEVAYNNYVRQRKKEMGSKHEEILKSVQISLDKLKILRVKLNNLVEIYYLTVDGTLSPYLFACLDGAFEWYILACNKGEIDSVWVEELIGIRKYVSDHRELNLGIREILVSYLSH